MFDMHFDVYDLPSALASRAALDGLIQYYVKTGALASEQAFGCSCEQDKKVAAPADKAEPSGLTLAVGKEQLCSFSGAWNDAKHGIATQAVELTQDLARDLHGVNEEPDGTDEGNAAYTKEQIKEASAHNPELATLVAKRGRKSAAEQARIQELAAAHFLGKTTTDMTPVFPAPVVEKVGEALQGLTAAQLHEMLGTSLPTTQAAPPASDIVSAITNPIATPATVAPATNDPLAALAAAEAAAQSQSAPTVAAVAPAETAAPDLDRMNRDALFELLQEAAEQDGRGLQWFKRVADAGGGIGKMTPDHIRDALRNPDKYSA